MSQLVGKSHHHYHHQRAAISIQDVNLQRRAAKLKNLHYAKLPQHIFLPVI
jgi:hypothetical protein